MTKHIIQINQEQLKELLEVAVYRWNTQLGEEGEILI